MKSHLIVVFVLAASTLFGQAANGTITGTVTDQTGAVVANAAVEARNTDTGVVYPTQTTSTGNYSLPQLPTGFYAISVKVTGFKTYTHTNLELTAAATLRQDVQLEVGATGENVTVTAEASLLKTEGGDLAHSITFGNLKDLPLLGIGASSSGSSGVRNPFNTVVAIPGVNYAPNFVMIVNGAPSNSAAYRVEGLDNTNHTVSYALQENQPSADAIQEVAVQTSNYSPEFGQAGGGLFNITMRSGTNQYHGSGYEYFVNEDLNAAYAFSNDGFGNKIRPRARRNDYGGTLGGPVWIPKVYNGHNRTFFFFNYEEYRESLGYFPNLTLPAAAYRTGDFSAISPNGGANFNKSLGVPTGALPSTDALGRPIFANTVYDPLTRATAANGQGYAQPFMNNMVPVTRFDPVAVAVQKLIPGTTNGNLINNGTGSNILARVSTIPSIKVDQTVGTKGHLSFYWSTTGTDAQYSVPNGNADGLPDIISGNRGTFIHSLTERLNYEHTLTPTLLLHLGAGYSRIRFFDAGAYQNFNCSQIGISGCQVNQYFPNIPSMVEPGSGNVLGGMQLMGNALAHTLTTTERPSYNTNATWIKGSHTFKVGGEVWFQGQITAPPSGTSMLFDTCITAGVSGGCQATSTSITNMGATALPQVGLNLSGWQVGFPYANFLLGDATQLTQKAPTDLRMGKAQWALFLQDSWKVNRKLTLDYGVRWDLATYPHEQYGRSANLGAIPNPAVGNRIGAPIFEANCNCSFGSAYPYGIGPRLGAAYQINSKTVLRGGWGLAYSFAPDINANSSNQVNNVPNGPNAFFSVVAPGALPQPIWPDLSPGQTPLPGQTSAFNGFTALDRQAARSPRQNQWSFSIQRELSRNTVVEASYVANRGVWWSGMGQQSLGLLNQVSPAVFSKYGLNPYSNPADNLLLSSIISSAGVIARTGVLTPYSGYPTSSTLVNALRAYPQFSTLNTTNTPTGNTWYDSLQIKGTHRLSRGLQANATFTWSKALVAIRQDIFNPASSTKEIQPTDQPFLFNANLTYTTPKVEALNKFKGANWLVQDWTLGVFFADGSGLPLTPPSATTTNNLATSGTANQMFRLPGQPLFLKDLNCGCINPYVDQVLNPAAWANPTNGLFGPYTLYPDFRSARRPQENLNIGRNFRIGKEGRYTLQIRADFVNIFNRTQIGNPITANPLAKPLKDGLGRYNGGFGVINDTAAIGAVPSISSNGTVGQLFQQPRNGTLIARFTF
jgi:carboxypeptidase family protein/TonB-dependent receptor-like protein